MFEVAFHEPLPLACISFMYLVHTMYLLGQPQAFHTILPDHTHLHGGDLDTDTAMYRVLSQGQTFSFGFNSGVLFYGVSVMAHSHQNTKARQSVRPRLSLQNLFSLYPFCLSDHLMRQSSTSLALRGWDTSRKWVIGPVPSKRIGCPGSLTSTQQLKWIHYHSLQSLASLGQSLV